jgi:hypothetical protein
MNPPANVLNLRWLVERAVELEAPPTQASSLLVAKGVPARKSYSLGEGVRFVLPTYDGGLQHLTSTIASCSPPEGIDPSRAAYGLLGRPTFIGRGVTPTYEKLMDLGIAIPESRLGSVQQILLASVLRPEQERLAEGYLSSPRVGAVARITTLIGSSGKSADDAWLSMDWATSSATYCTLLESLILDLERPRRLASSERAALVVSAEVDSVVDGSVASELIRVFEVHGLALAVLRAANMPVATLRASLLSQTPSVTVGLGSNPAVQDLLRRDDAGGSRRLAFAELDGVLASVRDELCSLSKVSPALFPLGSPEAGEASSTPQIPVTRVGRCLHDEGHRAYVEDLDTDLWWTKDTAGHAGTVFKTYTLSDSSLHHEACRDGHGLTIDKWKSDEGRVIPLTTLHACGSAHL